MAEKDLAERVRRYGSFLEVQLGKAEETIRRERELRPSTIGHQDDACRLSEAQGKETAYVNALRRLEDEFPEVYRSIKRR